MVTSLLRALALLVVSMTALAGEPKLAVFDVSGMSCSLCPITVRKALERVPGVLDASAELASKSAHVKYDPDKVSADALAKAVSDAGFPATVKH